jgi:hypothetical protein
MKEKKTDRLTGKKSERHEDRETKEKPTGWLAEIHPGGQNRPKEGQMDRQKDGQMNRGVRWIVRKTDR